MAYLERTDPEAFVGLEKKEPAPQYGYLHECPGCFGYGGWILRRDAYGPDQHFKASCGSCNGWGYTKQPLDHPHSWEHYKNIGHCLNQYKCAVCGQIETVDSSD